MTYNNFDVVEVNETNIIDTRDDMLFELCETGSVFILGHQVTMSDLLEDINQEDKDDVFAMLVSSNDNADAKDHAKEKLMELFTFMYDDAVIEEHYIDSMTDI